MKNVNELKQISDILDEREKSLEVREKKLEDRVKTLASAYKEFKILAEKLYGKY
jgi:chaperonin cofactor prefoldin